MKNVESPPTFHTNIAQHLRMRGKESVAELEFAMNTEGLCVTVTPVVNVEK